MLPDILYRLPGIWKGTTRRHNEESCATSSLVMASSYQSLNLPYQ